MYKILLCAGLIHSLNTLNNCALMYHNHDFVDRIAFGHEQYLSIIHPILRHCGRLSLSHRTHCLRSDIDVNFDLPACIVIAGVVKAH